MIVKGPIDLRTIGGPTFLADLNIESYQKSIDWEGWDVTQEQVYGTNRLGLKKDIGEDFCVSFKSNVEEEFYNYPYEKEEVGLEYKIIENGSLKMELNEDGEFLGLERKFEF